MNDVKPSEKETIPVANRTSQPNNSKNRTFRIGLYVFLGIALVFSVGCITYYASMNMNTTYTPVMIAKMIVTASFFGGTCATLIARNN